MDVFNLINTPKRRQIMLHMLYAYEEDQKVLPKELWGWRSIEWIAPRFDDTYYVVDTYTGKKIRKRLMEFLRVLKKDGVVSSLQRSEIEDAMESFLETQKVFELKMNMGIVKSINTLWRINPEVVKNAKEYFTNQDLVRTAVDLREVNILLNRLGEHLDTLKDIKEVLSSRLKDKLTQQETRGDMLDIHKELELCEAKILWIKSDLELFKHIIG